MFILRMTKEQLGQLHALFDAAVRAQGLQAAQLALSLAGMVDEEQPEAPPAPPPTIGP